MASIDKIHQLHSAALAALGWDVEIERDGDGEAISLRSRLKNGKLKKHPDVALRFEPLIWDQVVQPDGSFARKNIRPRTRPWIVRSRSFDAAKTYANIGAALTAFLATARVQSDES